MAKSVLERLSLSRPGLILSGRRILPDIDFNLVHPGIRVTVTWEREGGGGATTRLAALESSGSLSVGCGSFCIVTRSQALEASDSVPAVTLRKSAQSCIFGIRWLGDVCEGNEMTYIDASYNFFSTSGNMAWLL